MTSQLLIQIVLVLAVVAIGWMMLRSPGGARHQAGRRIVTLLFVLLAILAIVIPSLTSRVAHLVGVGRGTDLLLYVLVVAFLASILTSFRRNARLERQITRLAREIALDNASRATADGVHAAPPALPADAAPPSSADAPETAS